MSLKKRSEVKCDKKYALSLYDKYYGLIWYYIRKVIDNRHTVEDLVESTIADLIPRIPLLKTLEEEQVAKYVAQSAKHIARDHIKKISPVLMDTLPEIPDFNTPDVMLERKESRAEAAEIILETSSHIQEKYWALLYLKYYRKASPADICEILEISTTNFYTYLHRARLYFRKEVESHITVEGEIPNGTRSTAI